MIDRKYYPKIKIAVITIWVLYVIVSIYTKYSGPKSEVPVTESNSEKPAVSNLGLKDEAQAYANITITQMLETPKTAEFEPLPEVIDMTGGYFLVRGKVSFQNHYGALVTKPYAVRMKCVDQNISGIEKWKLIEKWVEP